MTASPAFAEGDRVRVRRGSRLLECTVEGIPAGDGLVTVRRADNGRRFLAVMTEILPLARAPYSINVQERVELEPEEQQWGARIPCSVCGGVFGHHEKCTNVLRAAPKPRKAGRSRSYLDWIRAMPCAWCKAPGPSDPDHFGEHGLGVKCSDYLTVPLCRPCHRTRTDTNALPDTDAAATGAFMERVQRRLLVEWLETGGERG